MSSWLLYVEAQISTSMVGHDIAITLFEAWVSTQEELSKMGKPLKALPGLLRWAKEYLVTLRALDGIGTQMIQGDQSDLHALAQRVKEDAVNFPYVRVSTLEKSQASSIDGSPMFAFIEGVPRPVEILRGVGPGSDVDDGSTERHDVVYSSLITMVSEQHKARIEAMTGIIQRLERL